MLEVESVTSGYGRVQVIFGISLSILEGEAVAVVGPNGAGKTTLLSTLVGLVSTWEGLIRFDDTDVSAVPAYRRVRMGMSLVPSGRSLFGPLSVEKNLQLGGGVRGVRGNGMESIFELFPELVSHRKQRVSTLSGGEQQMVAIGRALVGQPRVLFLDEPSLGLAPVVAERMYAALAELRARGQTIVVVEEKPEFVTSFADRYVVVNHGQIVAEGVTRDVNEEALARSYLG